MSSGPLYLGVDGGGTKTAAWVADQEGVKGRGLSGGSSHQGLPLEEAITHIQEAMHEALGTADARPADVAGVVFGLSGADYPEDFVKLTTALTPVAGVMPFKVVNDTEVALVGGARTGWGVVTLCGTGTNVLGRAPLGDTFHIGGMGYEFGDYGGGGDLIRTALHHAFKGAEGRGPETRLTPVVLEVLEAPDYYELSRRLYLHKLPRGKLRELAPLVFKLAQAGDSVAQDILIRMGTALGHSAGAAVRRLQTDYGVSDQDTVEVVMAGSVWGGPHPLLQDAFRLAIHRYAVNVDVHKALMDPVAGAVLMAVEMAQGPVEEVRKTLLV